MLMLLLLLLVLIHVDSVGVGGCSSCTPRSLTFTLTNPRAVPGIGIRHHRQLEHLANALFGGGLPSSRSSGWPSAAGDVRHR